MQILMPDRFRPQESWKMDMSTLPNVFINSIACIKHTKCNQHPTHKTSSACLKGLQFTQAEPHSNSYKPKDHRTTHMSNPGNKGNPHGLLPGPVPSLTQYNKRQVMIGTQEGMHQTQGKCRHQ